MPNARFILIVIVLAIVFVIFITSLLAKMLAIGLWILSLGCSVSIVIHSLASFSEARAKHKLLNFMASHQPARMSSSQEIVK